MANAGQQWWDEFLKTHKRPGDTSPSGVQSTGTTKNAGQQWWDDFLATHTRPEVKAETSPMKQPAHRVAPSVQEAKYYLEKPNAIATANGEQRSVGGALVSQYREGVLGQTNYQKEHDYYESEAKHLEKEWQELTDKMSGGLPSAEDQKRLDELKSQYEIAVQNRDAAHTRMITSENLAVIERWPEEDLALMQQYYENAMDSDPVRNKGLYSALKADKAENQIREKYGLSWDEFRKLAESYRWYQNEIATKKMQEETAKAVQGKTGAAIAHSALTLPATVAGTVTAPLDYLGQALGRTGQYRTLDPNARGNLPNVYSSTVRQTVAKDIEGDGTSIGRKAASYLYQGGMSALDTGARLLASGGNPTIAATLAGLGTFGQTVSQASQQGASPAEAMLYGTAAAGIEALTEELPLDELVKTAKGGWKGLKPAIINALKQAGVEATEEELSLIGTTLVEAAILQDKSSYKQRIQQLVNEQGMSVEEATAQADYELLGEAMDTAVVSAISGGLSSAGGSTVAYMGRDTSGAQTAQAGKSTAQLPDNMQDGDTDHQPVRDDGQSFEERYGLKLRAVDEGTENTTSVIGNADSVIENEQNVSTNHGFVSGDVMTAQMAGIDTMQAKRLAEATGREIVFFTAPKTEDGVDNGYYRDGKIYINVNSENPLAQIVSHELTHSVEIAESYQQLQNVIIRRIQETGGNLNQLRQQKQSLYAKMGQNLSAAETDSEIVAEYVEKNLLTDEKAIMDVVRYERSLAQKIKGWLDRLLGKLGNTDAQERAFIEKARNLYAQALRQTERTSGQQNNSMQQGADHTAEFDESGWSTNEDAIRWARLELAAGRMTQGEFDEISDAYARFMEQENAKEPVEIERHSFGGVNAKTADMDGLERAKQMEAQDVANETIRQETGWFRGMDGKWRWEIDDSTAQVAGELSNYMTLGELLSGAKIFEAYPDLRDVSIVFQSLDKGVSAQYNRQFDHIDVSYKLKNDPDAIRSAVLHEIQHAIQNREGFSSGATVRNWERRIKNGFDPRKSSDIREAQEAEQRIQQFREEDPKLYRDMMELDAMAPNLPRGAIDWDTLEQIEEDPPEWKAYDARRDELENIYGEKMWDFNSALYDFQRINKRPVRTAEELYWDTAGEIEARNVAGRRNLDAEGRKNTPPNLGDENTVFAESSGISLEQSIDEYPYNMQTVIREYIDAVDQDVLSFVEEVQAGEAWKGKKITVGTANSRMAADIKRLTGIENAEGVKILMNTNAVEHITKRHGVNGEHDQSMRNSLDIARINYILQNYDEVAPVKKKSSEYKNRDGSRASGIVISKKINGTYFVVEAVPDTGKIGVVSAYIDKNGALQVPDDSTPSRDVRNALAYAPEQSLAQENTGVKERFSVDNNVSEVERYMDEGNGQSVFRTGWLHKNQRMTEQIVANRQQTETADFQRWFGNSMAVNVTGEPLLLFHGSKKRFTIFETEGKPAWFSSNPVYSAAYAGERRNAERFLPGDAIYGKSDQRVIPAYIRALNPADLGDTDGTFDQNVERISESLGIEESLLRDVWKKTGRKEQLWEVVNTSEMVALLKNYGYDSIKAREYGTSTWGVFDGTQVKSAIANKGTFNGDNPDIRHSFSPASEHQPHPATSENEQKVSDKKVGTEETSDTFTAITRDTLPRKAREYLARTEWKLLGKIGQSLSVPRFAQQNTLKGIVQEISDEYLSTGRVSDDTINSLFDRAYKEGVVADREFYEQYKEVKDHMRTTSVTLSDQDKSNIADFSLFRKSTMGTLRIVNNGGLPVDVAYMELQGMAPELFPGDITHPADQLMRMFEVSKSIAVSERTLNEYYGESASDFRAYAKNDFDAAIGDIVSELRNVKRYANDRAATQETADEAPKTPEEAKQYYAQLKDARRKYDRVMAKNLLTDHDSAIVGKLLTGQTNLENLDPNKENVKGIAAVYEAKQEYERIAKLLAEYRKDIKAGHRDTADGYLESANNWKDKGSGLAYSRETMERNVEDIVPDRELAKRINREYFETVRDAEAMATRFKNDWRDRVRRLNLSRMKKRGNVLSEASAVQLLGEAYDNIRVLEKSRGRLKQRDGKTLQEWRDVVDKVWAENPNLDADKIENAIKEFRKMYDVLFELMNDVRIANGYEPANYRSGYFPHFQPGDGDSVLAHFGKALGIDTSVTALPTTINGLTHTFKPGIQWFGNAQERIGFNTTYDAVEGFDKYIEGIAGVIYQTENIQKLRALGTQIRYRTSDEGIRKQVDAVYSNPNLTEEEKQAQIEYIYKNGKYALSNFVNELDEYTNLLANKKSRLDRTVESLVGRMPFYNTMKWLERRVGANMIGGNLSSAFTNFIPLTQAWGQLSTKNLLHGMWDARRNVIKSDGFVDASSFLTNRRGSDPIAKAWTERVGDTMGIVMEMIDDYVSYSVAKGAYYQNKQRGLSETEAIHQADIFAARVMAERSKGGMPTLFESRNPGIKLFTQFQLEVNNQFSEVFKDMPRAYKNKALVALGFGFLKYFLGAWLYNELFEELAGRRPALDPIDIASDFVKDLMDDGIGEALPNLATNAFSQLPFSSGLTLFGIETDGGRFPVSSAIPNIPKLWDAATNNEWSAEKRWQTAKTELAKPLTYLASPFGGGGQIAKTVKGIKAVAEGGSYAVDSKTGEKVLQYPVFKDDGDNAWDYIRAGVFGKSALDEAQDWVDSGFKNLSTEETKVYQDLVSSGAKDYEAYKLIKDIKAAKTLKGADRKKAEQEALESVQFTEEEERLAVGLILGTDMETESGNPTEYAKFLSATNAGLSVDRYMEIRSAGVDTDKFLKLVDQGMDADEAADFALSMKDLEPEAGEDRVSAVQEWRLAVDRSSTVAGQLSMLKGVMKDSQFAKAETATVFDISLDAYVGYYEIRAKYDADGNGSYSQTEVKTAIDSMSKYRLTNAEKAALWQLVTGTKSAKNNPYSTSEGQRVIDYLNAK